MEKLSSAQAEQLKPLLAQRIEDQRTALTDRYFSVLQEALFSSRAEIRPSTLKVIAAEEVETLLLFFKHTEASVAKRGEQLHQAGLAARAILRMAQVTRKFLLSQLENDQIAPVLEIVDAYGTAVIEGFVQSINDTNKIERAQLERVLTALQQRGDN